MRVPSGAGAHSRRSRLSRSGDFDRVFRNGRAYAGRELVLYVFPRLDEGQPRLGLSVSRRVGGAVERNLVKRLLREAFTFEGERLTEGTDAVVVARQDARALAEREGLAGIRRALGELIDRVVEGRADRASGTRDAAASGHASEVGERRASNVGEPGASDAADPGVKPPPAAG